VPVGCSTGPERNSTLDSIILQTDSYARSTTSLSLEISSRATRGQELRPAALRTPSITPQRSAHTAQRSLLKAESTAEARRGVFKRAALATTKHQNHQRARFLQISSPPTNTLLRLRLRLASPGLASLRFASWIRPDSSCSLQP
jgi:hypothetical protein